MKPRLLIYNFSITIILFTLITYTADYLLHGSLSSFFTLKTETVVVNLDLWRIITFPLAAGSIESVLLFIFTFYAIGQKVELMLEKSFYPVLLFLLVCLQGTLLTLVFHKNFTEITGMEGVCFFILTLYTLLKFNDRKRNILVTRSFRFTFILVVTWVCAKVLHNSLMDNYDILPSAASMIFGVGSGLLIYMQMAFVRRMKLNQTEKNPGIEIPKPEELSMALISQRELKKFNQTIQDDYSQVDQNSGFSEDRLNQILDKILEQGKESLSPAEIKYLNDYSKSL